MIFDSHAHYDDEAYSTDRHEILSSMPQQGVCGIINAAVDIETAKVCIELAKKYPFVYATVGVHPENAGSVENDYLKRLSSLSHTPKVVAIGEIGLDYHYDTVAREIQKQIFEQQLMLAKELDMPVVVHDREAHGDILELLKKYRVKGLVHCFSGSVEMMREIVRLGMSISLGGAVTFKNARHPVDVAREVPIDRLLLETDAPYMSPVPFRGKRCDSSLIDYTAAKIAEIRAMDKEDLIDKCRDNTLELFGINDLQNS